ncbi:glycosyltransferase [bacterium]|nr:glycosyltransferase [bacterium]
MKKLVWFSEIKWDYLVTRKQHILKRFPADIEILFIEPYAVGKKQHWLPRRENNVTILTIPFLKNIPQPFLSGIFNIRTIRWIFGLTGQIYFNLFSIMLGFSTRERVIGLSAVYWGKIAAKLPAALHFYDANDAHLDFPNTPSWLREYLIVYLVKSDLAFAVSPEIHNSIKALGAKNIHQLGNGVDFEHFSHHQDKPEALAGFTNPILGYAGAMDWLDADLIRKICQAYPDHEIVLIGPEIRPGWYSTKMEFKHITNLHYLGKVAYAELPAFVQSFAVALIPFVVDELTRPLNPNKLYEYSAAGKAVVSMNYSSTIDNLKGVLFVGNTHAEFIQQIGSALKHPEDPARQTLALKHSWDEIAGTMVQVLAAGHQG